MPVIDRSFPDWSAIISHNQAAGNVCGDSRDSGCGAHIFSPDGYGANFMLLKMMDFVLIVMDFALKMMDLAQSGPSPALQCTT